MSLADAEQVIFDVYLYHCLYHCLLAQSRQGQQKFCIGVALSEFSGRCQSVQQKMHRSTILLYV